ncbi:hypothetical protein HBH95_138300 [Parastagonospora nodorum]|nr:hypothetical protein HBH95_138300 [Parastagonospora nodorum]
MAETEKGCVICGGEEKDGELLIAAPCGQHWVCPDDISSFFERATQNESLFPPKCCGQMFMLQEYEEYVPFDIAWAYQVKEQGEYAILAKFRVYCGNPACAKFLHPSTHVTDQPTNITYAICEDDSCGKLSCIACKNILAEGTNNHVCKKDENEEKFQKLATENGYQNCSQCSAVVELMEACNHVTCSCGYDFCYLCGKEWVGLHGCPHYGQATFDTEGYNQDGYHRDSSLNREGLTRRQEMARRRGEDPDDEDDDETDPELEDEEWEVMQHITPEQRMAVNILHGAAREDALDNLRIQLFESQGITFGTDPGPMEILTERQLDIVEAVMQEIHAAHDPLLNPLLNRLSNEAATMDDATVVSIYRPIADLYVRHMSPANARQIIDFIPVLNDAQIANLALILGLRLTQEAAGAFAEYLLEQLLAAQPEEAAPLTAEQQLVLDQVLQELEDADMPLLPPLLNRLTSETMDALTSTQVLSRIAELHIQHLPTPLVGQMASLLAALTAPQIAQLGARLAPDLAADRVAEFVGHYTRWLGEAASNATGDVNAVLDEGDVLDEGTGPDMNNMSIERLIERVKESTPAEATYTADAGGETRSRLSDEWDDDDL